MMQTRRLPINAVPDALWARLSEFIAGQTGLHFPPERHADLQRGLAEASAEFGFADVAHCANWLLSVPLTAAELHVLASHLTIGETYFFRERKTFDALAESILPELIRRRRGHAQHLHLWSAACSTGEEVYSLAILVHELLPDWRDWRVTILGTDINKRFLQRAAAGVYGEWSFRESSPEFKDRYFTRTEDRRFALVPEIRNRVSFAQLNLAQTGFPSRANGGSAMDVIFCRNVLIYFTPSQAPKLVENLRHTLTDDGWLAVSPSECSQTLFSGFVAVNFPGTILYQKRGAAEHGTPASNPIPAMITEEQAPTLVASALSPWATQDEPPVDRLPAEAEPASASSAVSSGHSAATQARALANQGNLSDALVATEQWIATDKLDAAAHYLHAMVLQELGERAAARSSFQRAVYLRPEFTLAHFALGNGARAEARRNDAHRHFENALRVLRCRPPEEPVPESDGLTAGRLAEIICALISPGKPSDEKPER